jgi:uncharacterized protein
MRHTPFSSANSSPSWSAPAEPPANLPLPGLAARAALALLRAYKYLLSPWFTGACRFVPTCGDYAAEAIARHGVTYGSWLAAKRLARCQPFGSHGHDPVPVSEPNGQFPTGAERRPYSERSEESHPRRGSHPYGAGVPPRPPYAN